MENRLYKTIVLLSAVLFLSSLFFPVWTQAKIDCTYSYKKSVFFNQQTVSSCRANPREYAYNTNPGNSNESLYGLNVLFSGWLGLFVGMPGWYAWYANIILLITAILTFFKMHKSRVYFIFALIALQSLLMLSSFVIFTGGYPIDEGGVGYAVPLSLNIGGYLWMASGIIYLAVPIVYFLYVRKRKLNTPI